MANATRFAGRPGPANPVLEESLRRLSRYGYAGPDGAPADAGAAADWPAEWARLKGDFAPAGGGGAVADLGALAEPARAVAMAYLRLRVEADALLARCEDAHRDILARGITPDRVEAYAAVRDAYEDKVEAFGAARAALAGLLAAS